MKELNRQDLEAAVILAAQALARFMLAEGFTLPIPATGKVLTLDVDRAVVKACPRCLAVKPHEEFNLDKSKADSLSTYCKGCDKEKRKEWRIRNPEREQAAGKLWREKNPGYARDAAENLTDTYVAATLGFKAGEAPPILIETKRISLQIKRLLKEKK